MRFSTLALSFAVTLISVSSFAQKKAARAAAATIDRLKTHIQYLADDKLEGRRAGSNGEKLAMDYIAGQFTSAGLQPKGTDGFFQAFDINEGKQINKATSFSINNTQLVAGKDFFPFTYSSNQTIEATPAIAVQEPDMPWFYDLKETLEENKNNPHFDLGNYIYTNSKKARSKGASAVIVYNSSAIDDKLAFNGKDKLEKLDFPVVYISKETAQKYFKDEAATLTLKFTTDIGEKKRAGHNVVGYIDNGAATTAVFGAHFDHLGYGEDGNSMIRNSSEKSIHNGADDNASGTAALIELARMLKSSKAKNNNYLFIAFSGEELGLFGSKYFVENPTIDLKAVSYMINMDMVGRLNDSTKVLTVGGIGTSPVWGELFPAIPVVETKKSKQPFIFKYDSSGTGPSDHTSFYRKDIPVLFYFTGLHTDYHKPSDDADKINYNGELAIIQNIYGVVESLNSRHKLAFTKTRETQTTTNASFRVTLGIMPDYTFAGTGVRADGVTDGRPGAKAGLKAGDVIIQLGDISITSMETYMQALGKFSKGEKTTVKFKRGNETKEAPIEF
jgi:aminopeptidase YwaD